MYNAVIMGGYKEKKENITAPEEIDPKLLSPEYWDGHSLDDDCELNTGKQDSIILRGDLKRNYFASDTLTEFFSAPDRSPIRRFTNGELFEAREYPEGTILKINREKLYETQGDEHYNRKDFWGVTNSYLFKGNKRYEVRAFIPRLYPSLLPEEQLNYYHTFHFDPDMRVGGVEHTRNIGLTSADILTRVNSLEIYHMGSGVKEKAAKRSFIPRVVFRPNTA